jgi:hypothetical protein
VREARAFLDGQRVGDGPFDLAIGGTRRGADWERERRLMAAVAEAGATWWEEWIPPGDPADVRAAVARGPLRVR